MKTLSVVGIVLLVIGVAVFGYGATNPVMATSTTTSSANSVASQGTRLIDAGGFWGLGTVLQTGQIVSGNFTLTDYNASAGPIFLYVQDEAQYIQWGRCAPCASPSVENWTLPASGVYSFKWTVPGKGGYYFVFDNEYYNADSNAAFAADATTTITNMVTTTSPNMSLDVVGAVLGMVGAAVIAFNAMKSEKKH